MKNWILSPRIRFFPIVGCCRGCLVCFEPEKNMRKSKIGSIPLVGAGYKNDQKKQGQFPPTVDGSEIQLTSWDGAKTF